MTIAAVALVAYALGVVTPLLVRAVAFVVARSRMPIQMFEGRLFPHPMDADWKVEPGRATFGGVIEVVRRGHMDFVVRELSIGGVTIAHGGRVERYLSAIERAHDRRRKDRALEALP